MNLDVFDIYRTAWRSFAKWWVSLCLVAGVVVALELIPRLLVLGDVVKLFTLSMQSFMAMASGDIDALEPLAEQMTPLLDAVQTKFMVSLGIAIPVVAALTVVLLIVAVNAVRDGSLSRPSILRTLQISGAQVAMSIVCTFGLFLLVIPGLYLYVRLYFVSLILVDSPCSVRGAIVRSFSLTRGHLVDLGVLVLVNSFIQLASLPTIIGAIPVTGFASTARAVAYRRLAEALPATEKGNSP